VPVYGCDNVCVSVRDSLEESGQWRSTQILYAYEYNICALLCISAVFHLPTGNRVVHNRIKLLFCVLKSSVLGEKVTEIMKLLLAEDRTAAAPQPAPRERTGRRTLTPQVLAHVPDNKKKRCHEQLFIVRAAPPQTVDKCQFQRFYSLFFVCFLLSGICIFRSVNSVIATPIYRCITRSLISCVLPWFQNWVPM
jgi:hypothetical protein